MKRFICNLTAMMVAVVMVFGYVPLVESTSAVPRNVQVPMPIGENELGMDFVNNFFPNKPDVHHAFFRTTSGAEGLWMDGFHVRHEDGTLWACA